MADTWHSEVAILDAHTPSDVCLFRGEAKSPRQQIAHSFRTLGQHLIGEPVRSYHHPGDFLDVRIRYFFVEQIAHRIHENAAGGLRSAIFDSSSFLKYAYDRSKGDEFPNCSHTRGIDGASSSLILCQLLAPRADPNNVLVEDHGLSWCPLSPDSRFGDYCWITGYSEVIPE